MSTRPVQIINRPIAPPGVCISCGVQDREYFVDTGLDVNHQYFMPVWDGVIYLCNECMESLVTDYQRALEKYHDGIRDSGEIGTDRIESGGDDASSDSIDEYVDDTNTDESQPVEPVAATLDSTQPFRLELR